MKKFQEWSQEQEITEAWFGFGKNAAQPLPEITNKIKNLISILRLNTSLDQIYQTHRSLFMALYNVIASEDGSDENAVRGNSLQLIWDTLIKDIGYDTMKLNGIAKPMDILTIGRGNQQIHPTTSAIKFDREVVDQMKQKSQTKGNEKQQIRNARVQRKVNQITNPQQTQQQSSMNSGNLAQFKNMAGGQEALTKIASLGQNLSASANQNEKEAGNLIALLVRFLS